MKIYRTDSLDNVEKERKLSHVKANIYSTRDSSIGQHASHAADWPVAMVTKPNNVMAESAVAPDMDISILCKLARLFRNREERIWTFVVFKSPECA